MDSLTTHKRISKIYLFLPSSHVFSPLTYIDSLSQLPRPHSQNHSPSSLSPHSHVTIHLTSQRLSLISRLPLTQIHKTSLFSLSVKEKENNRNKKIYHYLHASFSTTHSFTNLSEKLKKNLSLHSHQKFNETSSSPPLNLPPSAEPSTFIFISFHLSRQHPPSINSPSFLITLSAASYHLRLSKPHRRPKSSNYSPPFAFPPCPPSTHNQHVSSSLAPPLKQYFDEHYNRTFANRCRCSVARR